MPNIFISYSRGSKAIAITLASDIEALGHTAWFDQEISGGGSWWDQILAQVRECDVFAFVLDPEALGSAACKREYGYAADLGKSILPILVSDQVSTDLLPPALSQIQFVDYRNRDRDAAFRLARALNALPAPGPLPDPLPPPPEAPISYLGSLIERVETTSTLSYEAQSVLVADLRRSIRDLGAADHTHRLLETLRKRRDLFATFAEEVDELLGKSRESPPPPLPPEGTGPPPPEPSDSPFLWALNSAKAWALGSAGRAWERVVRPETGLGAAVRGALVGFVFYLTTSIVVEFIGDAHYGYAYGHLDSIYLYATAGAIARKSLRAGVIALVVGVITSVVNILLRTPFDYAMYYGGIGAILVASIFFVMEKIRVLIAHYRRYSGTKLP